MKLREILPPDAEFDRRHADLEIGAVTADSRAVKRGDIFVAIAGGKADGLRFIGAAISAGAAAIVAERSPETALPQNIAFARVANARRALALIAAKIYPRQPGTIAAVTGTSGKTSVAAFTRQIWSALGHRAEWRNLRLAHHTGSRCAASLDRCTRGRRRHSSCDRSFLAWARPIPA
jgi:UDP-N-acetylmuramoyl-L-alanyl-D-glutamate--2,6-diaminopimelate ligase